MIYKLEIMTKLSEEAIRKGKDRLNGGQQKAISHNS